MFLVEILNADGDYIPFGCADTFYNALVMIDGRAGRISNETSCHYVANSFCTKTR